MKILLTGASGYIGKRLLPRLLAQGHTVWCLVRDKQRFSIPFGKEQQVHVIEADLTDPDLDLLSLEFDGAYYLVHSMSSSGDFEDLEIASARNFRVAIEKAKVKHVVYLGGIVNEAKLSKHLASRQAVEIELASGKYNFTAFRSAIIIGSGSASFEIIRNLVEKLPLMIAPIWLMTKCQPIGIKDVISILSRSMLNEPVYNNSYDIGGPSILTYKQMLLQFAAVRQLPRKIIIVPVMTPKLSSYWLYFITSTSFKLAASLVDSMKVNVVCRPSNINSLLDIEPISYKEALVESLSLTELDQVESSWVDSYTSSDMNKKIADYLTVPTFGCHVDHRVAPITSAEQTLDRIWSIGGKNGWYYATCLWRMRGFLDKVMGGVGLRRGRTHQSKIQKGDVIDFWRVLDADRSKGRLLLLAEMKLPGEAWLEFKIDGNELHQTATFRPRGLLGRLYWILIYPLHLIVFKGMVKQIAR